MMNTRLLGRALLSLALLTTTCSTRNGTRTPDTTPRSWYSSVL